MQLAWPTLALLPGYVSALEHGWTPDNERGREAAEEELLRIEESPSRFLETLVDVEARGGPVELPDGSLVPRLPGYRKWMWDGEFCGSINLRWQPGTGALPWYCLGHVGYSVVPWKRRQGHATHALDLLLAEARALALPYLELTTDTGNLASQKVILANGGVLVGEEEKPQPYRGRRMLRYRIDLDRALILRRN
ncbi:MAG TPA: GNAT family N-acetyltransferase [Ramlibacter sp.]|nr:GNAT family N-acetyltransferase [Ramlibacter sp.]